MPKSTSVSGCRARAFATEVDSAAIRPPSARRLTPAGFFVGRRDSQEKSRRRSGRRQLRMRLAKGRTAQPNLALGQALSTCPGASYAPLAVRLLPSFLLAVTQFAELALKRLNALNKIVQTSLYRRRRCFECGYNVARQ